MSVSNLWIMKENEAKKYIIYLTRKNMIVKRVNSSGIESEEVFRYLPKMS